MREDIKAIVEDHSLLNEKLDILKEENEKEHKEILSEIKSSYVELNNRVSALENK